MDSYIILSILICLSAAFSYINHRFIKLPFVIGLFFLSTVLSLVILSSKFWIAQPYSGLRTLVEQTNISKFILNIMLGFLLFAGSLHSSWALIKKHLAPIALLSLAGVLVSTVLVAFMFYWLSNALGLNIDFIYCLLFGALISPTDPIAVLGILTKANVPQKIETTIVGESLFNDGVGVVTFIALLEAINSGGGTLSFSRFGILFLQQAVGGVFFGLVLGFILHKLLKSIDHYETEVLLTIAFVMAGYGLSSWLHVSGALAMVIMGLFVGNYHHEQIMSRTSQEYVNRFWQVVDVILNAVLFILIAFVLVVVDFKAVYILVGILSVFIVLISRILVVYVPKIIFPRIMSFNHQEAMLLVWGGLRGGLSIALVLSLAESEAKPVLLIATYFCVLFSILIQGLTIGKMAKFH